MFRAVIPGAKNDGVVATTNGAARHWSSGGAGLRLMRQPARTGSFNGTPADRGSGARQLSRMTFPDGPSLLFAVMNASVGNGLKASTWPSQRGTGDCRDWLVDETTGTVIRPGARAERVDEARRRVGRRALDRFGRRPASAARRAAGEEEIAEPHLTIDGERHDVIHEESRYAHSAPARMPSIRAMTRLRIQSHRDTTLTTGTGAPSATPQVKRTLVYILRVPASLSCCHRAARLAWASAVMLARCALTCIVGNVGSTPTA